MQCGIPPPLSIPEGGLWPDQSEELLDAAFYGELLLCILTTSLSLLIFIFKTQAFSPLPLQLMVCFPRHLQKDVTFLNPIPSPTVTRGPHKSVFPTNNPNLLGAPPGSTLSFMSTTTATTIGPQSAVGQDTFTIKAMKEDVNVLPRVSYSMEFAEVREKIRLPNLTLDPN